MLVIIRNQINAMPTVSTPFLLLPSIQQNFSDSSDIFKGLDHVDDLWYVGSSHGWLIVLDAEAEPFLLNPTSGSRIKLPSFPPNFKPPVSNSYFVQFLRKTFISKAILLYRPSIRSYLVVIIYGTEQKIAFCHSTSKKWTHLSESSHAYCDIIFTSYHRLYTLTNKGFIEGYDFRPKIRRKSPKKFLHIQLAGKIEEDEIINSLRDKFSTQLYLVESMGRELFLVIRYIGNFVTSDGEVIEEADLMISEDSHPLVCPYRTKHFSVYKLDLEVDLKWQKIKSLDDRILFVGANESTLLTAQGFSGFEANSIYFTDDRWDEMNMDYLYGGHDLGVFNVADGSIKPLIQGVVEKIDPAPIWICVKP